MRYLGIDYGAKRVGLALSDESGSLAFPHLILENHSGLEKRIAKICVEQGVKQIVLGQPLDFRGQPNPIMKKVGQFKLRLEEMTSLPVALEPEWLTTKLAERSAPRAAGRGRVDDAAAALILQTYLDKL